MEKEFTKADRDEDTSNFIDMDISGREEDDAGNESNVTPEKPEQLRKATEEKPKQTSPDFIGNEANRGDSGLMKDSGRGHNSQHDARLKSPVPQMLLDSHAPTSRQGMDAHILHPPKSSYYYGPPTASSAFGTEPVGTIGLHHPREIIRIERDYEHGELCQFSSSFPLELEGRLTPTQFLETINSINERLISAHSVKAAMLDNTIAILSLYISTIFRKTHYEKEMQMLRGLIEQINKELFHSRGLRILWPRQVGFLFLEIEYY